MLPRYIIVGRSFYFTVGRVSKPFLVKLTADDGFLSSNFLIDFRLPQRFRDNNLLRFEKSVSSSIDC